MLQFYLRMTANHAYRREFVLRRWHCTDWKYVHSSKGYTTRHLPLQRTSTPSRQNPSARDTRVTYSRTRQTNHSKTWRDIVGYETSVYIRWRDPMILDITIHGYDMWPIHWPNVTGFHSEVFQIFHMQIFVTSVCFEVFQMLSQTDTTRRLVEPFVSVRGLSYHFQETRNY